jgi:hypothetical protein
MLLFSLALATWQRRCRHSSCNFEVVLRVWQLKSTSLAELVADALHATCLMAECPCRGSSGRSSIWRRCPWWIDARVPCGDLPFKVMMNHSFCDSTGDFISTLSFWRFFLMVLLHPLTLSRSRTWSSRLTNSFASHSFCIRWQAGG